MIYKIILFVCFILLLNSCSKRNSSLENQKDSQRTDIKKNLDELDEILPGYDYGTPLAPYYSSLPTGNSITKFKYFVVVSYLDQATTYSIIDNDIRYTIDAMVQNYCSSLPETVTPIILFDDYNTYKNFSTGVFNIPENDLSPYGFYKISKNMILIRYVSWKGSPGHEVTHTFTKKDFPEMPSWFDEGLASLHEKATYKNKKLVGDFSWRILSLRRAFNDNTYTGLRALMETNDDELYGKRSTFYYAQSRYLLMYLQEKNLLEKYYKKFRDTFDSDPTGISQLESLLGQSLESFDEKYVDYINSFKN